jgi:uncharacterized protein
MVTAVPSRRTRIAQAGQTLLLPEDLLPVRIRQVAGAFLLTGDLGGHAFLEPDEYRRWAQGQLRRDEPAAQRLKDAELWAEGDQQQRAKKLLERKSFLHYGPNLHIFVVTLRCNHSCQYCHASRARMDAFETDMDIETAERSVDFAFQSTSPFLTIEFQGGEPLANWPVVEHLIEYSLQKNALAGKNLMFALVTNLSLMDDEKLAYLIERKVQISTSLDGPQPIHDAVRVYRDGNSYAATVGWIRKINAKYREMGLDPMLYRVEALPTVTKLALPHAKALIDEYAALGCHSIYLRHLDPFGFAGVTKERLGYSIADFLEFYRGALDYVVELNRNGTDFVERTAAMLFTKILGGRDPNFLDLRSPCGAGIGQIAYNHDGRMFTCDEGRMVDRSGDDCFAIGHVAKDEYRAVLSGEVVRAMTTASTLQGQPGCADCAYLPWCGICPVHNYTEQGSIHGRMIESTWCQKYMGVLDLLMTRLRQADDFERALYQRWASPRALEHYVQQ